MNISEDFKTVFIIGLTLISLFLYHLVYFSEKVKLYFKVDQHHRMMQLKLFIFRKTAGFVFLGLIPAMLLYVIFRITPADLGWQTGRIEVYLVWITGLALLIILINYLAMRSPENSKHYPQIKIADWDLFAIIIEISGWALYLVAYEFIFRGILLNGTIGALGVWPAIAVNVTIYSAIHFEKGWKEALGAIVFGTVLCLITVKTHSVFPAVFLHFCLAISAEWFAIRFNHAMHFSIKREKNISFGNSSISY